MGVYEHIGGASGMERPDSLDTTDISGATTRPLPVRSTPHAFNTNNDIEKSSPFLFTTGRFPRSTRCTEPLNPAYVLPSVQAYPIPPATAAPRDVLWTVPQRRWRPEPRDPIAWTNKELYGRTHFFQKTLEVPREALASADITGPQFRVEEKRFRGTDPLLPTYVYDGAPIDAVKTRRPHYGSQFERTPEENYNLRTDDILTEKIFNREYPKALIQTRPTNRLDDITGAQSDTRCSAPKLWKIKDPSLNATKLTNRVMDIEGAIAGTAGQGPPLYRTRKQAAAISIADTMATTRASTAFASAARAADIASVQALP